MLLPDDQAVWLDVDDQLKAFYGHHSFLEKFGSVDATGRLYISANWQAGLQNAVSAGQVCGLLVSFARPMGRDQ